MSVLTTKGVGLQDILLITETDEEQLLMRLEWILPAALPMELHRLAQHLGLRLGHGNKWVGALTCSLPQP